MIIQLLKIQKERKIVKLTENNIFKNSSPLKTKGNNNNNNSNEISPNNYSNDLPNNSHLNLTHIENSEPLNDEINESKQNFELKAENDNIQSKKTKNKDLSLSDLILDSSFLSPKTASNLKYEEFGLKNMRKEEKYAALQKNNMILIEEASSNKKSLEEKSNSINESQKFKKTMITNRNLETCGIYSDEDKSNKYDEILSQMKEKIRKDKLLSFRLKDSQPKNERTKYSHNKHNSEILRSTPSGLFLNPLNNSNSNSETKLSSNIENISFNSKLPAKFNRNNSSLGTAPTQKNVSQSNIMQRIMKRNPLQTNSLFFSNQTQTKIMTADFNKEIGFLQNIICFNKHDGGNTIRSEPIIGPIQKEFTHNFSKLFNNNNKENKKFNNFDPMFNCSFPGGRKINKNKQQIFVKQNGSCIAERKNPKKKVVNKSMEINDGWGSINSSQLNFANLKMSYSKKNLKNLI